MDPDPVCPITSGSGGFGSATLVTMKKNVQHYNMRPCWDVRDWLPRLILLKTGTEVERPTRPRTRSTTYNRILRVINKILKGGRVRTKLRKSQNPQICRHTKSGKSADLPKMWQVADMRFADSIFLVICDLPAKYFLQTLNLRKSTNT